MPSKAVTDRQRWANAVVASLRSHGGQVTEGLVEALAPSLRDGEEREELARCVGWLGDLAERELARRKAALVAADEAHLTELAADRTARERRDQGGRRLFGAVVQARTLLRGLFGRRGGGPWAGLGGPTSQDPTSLLRQAQRMITRLEEGDLPPDRYDGGPVELDPAALAAELRSPVAELEAALKAVARERWSSRASLVAKNRARDDFDAFYRPLLAGLDGLFRLAGRSVAARNLRSSVRRRRSPGKPAPENPGAPGSAAESPTPGPDDALGSAPPPS